MAVAGWILLISTMFSAILWLLENDLETLDFNIKPKKEKIVVVQDKDDVVVVDTFKSKIQLRL